MNKRDEVRSNLLLFVAGLPSKATSQEVCQFVARYGNFRILRLRTNKKNTRLVEANPQNNIRRGFCILEALELDSFLCILDASGLQIKGRNILVTKFRDTEEFSAYAASLTKKKVILTDVPKVFSTAVLHELLDHKFGKIKKLTHCKTGKHKDDIYGLHFKRILIEFIDESSATEALEKGEIVLYWNLKRFKVFIQSYGYSGNKDMNTSNMKKGLMNSLIYSGASTKLRRIEPEFKEIYSATICSELPQINEQQIFSNKRFHVSKPTSHKYFQIRNQAIEFYDVPPNTTPHLRFNILLK